MSRDTFQLSQWGRGAGVGGGRVGAVLLASSGLKPEMLLNILQGIEQPPQQRNYPVRKVNSVQV